MYSYGETSHGFKPPSAIPRPTSHIHSHVLGHTRHSRADSAKAIKTRCVSPRSRGLSGRSSGIPSLVLVNRARLAAGRGHFTNVVALQPRGVVLAEVGVSKAISTSRSLDTFNLQIEDASHPWMTNTHRAASQNWPGTPERAVVRTRAIVDLDRILTAVGWGSKRHQSPPAD